jgi:hypothetical protein
MLLPRAFVWHCCPVIIFKVLVHTGSAGQGHRRCWKGAERGPGPWQLSRLGGPADRERWSWGGGSARRHILIAREVVSGS